MAAARFLVDTDVLVDHLRVARRVPSPPEASAYSSITRAELYAGRDADEAIVDELLSAFEEIALDRAVAEEAGRIRRSTGLPLADAAIAATALLSGRTLVTRNRRQFARVPRLKLFMEHQT